MPRALMVQGICGGYQILGTMISDPKAIAGPAGIDRAQLREWEINRLTACVEQNINPAALVPRWHSE